MDGYFQDNVILNYLNEMILEAIDVFEKMLINKANINEILLDEHFPYHMRLIPWYRQAKRMSKFINMDSIYFQFADAINSNSTRYFKENLGDIKDFRDDEKHYIPILDPRKNSNYTMNYFRTPEEPYLIYETNFDHIEMDK